MELNIWLAILKKKLKCHQQVNSATEEEALALVLAVQYFEV